MPTQRLYEDDPFLGEIEARIVSRAPRGAGEEVVLDRTVFFATSGGQPHDTGLLAGVPVIDVTIRGDEIVHVTGRPLPAELAAGAIVRGAIDMARRLDAMRQHHGQHLLSAAFFRTAKLETTAVHFGAERSTLDLARAASEPQIAAAAALANQIVLEDAPVTVHRVARADLGKFALRREPGVEAELLRIVEVEGFDATPCSGTHPRRTGQVGAIAVIGSPEKVKGGIRLTFVCGERALRDHHEKDAAVTSLARELSTSPDQLAAAIAKLRAGEKQARARAKSAEEALAKLEAKALAEKHSVIVVEDLGFDRSDESIGFLAAQLVALGRAAVLGSVQRESEIWLAVLVIAVPPGSGLDAAAALRAALPAIHGRGGGNTNFARGAGSLATGLAASLAAAKAALAGTSPPSAPRG
jgi:alanyl-tRNA synthetase